MILLSKTTDVKEQNLCKVEKVQTQPVTKGIYRFKILTGIK